MIELRHIHRRFQVGEQQVHALNDINLSIERGEYVSIMGPSGSGKSTLLQPSACWIPDSGTYLLDQHDVTALSDRNRRGSAARLSVSFSSFFIWFRASAPPTTWACHCCWRACRLRTPVTCCAGPRRGQPQRSRRAPPRTAQRRPAPTRRHCPRHHHATGPAPRR